MNALAPSDYYATTRAKVIADRAKVVEHSTDKPAAVDPIWEAAEIETQTLTRFVIAADRIGDAMLRSFWELNKLPLETLYGVKNLTEYTHKMLAPHGNVEYALRMVNVVERIFLPVHRAEKQGKPFKNPDTGEIVTTDLLLQTPGLVQKLNVMSPHFEDAGSAGNREQQTRILGDVLNKPASAVKDIARMLSQNKATDAVKARYAVTVTENGHYRVEFSELTADQLRMLEARIENIAERL